MSVLLSSIRLPLHRRTACLLPALLLCLLPLAAQPQEPDEPAANPARDTPSLPALSVDTTHVAVRGQVREAGSGIPLARVLVQIEGDARNATLTDGDGRFTLDDVPVGPQIVSLRKPGYRDQSIDAQPSLFQPDPSSSHNVIVAATMPALQLSMQREAVLHGTAHLDSGDPAEDLTVQLFRQKIENGHLVWRMTDFMRARADGSFRFAHLAPGAYALLTRPWIERTSEAAPAAPTWGYAPASAGDLRPLLLGSGDDAWIDLTLNRTLFQPVTIALAGGDRAQNYEATITDAAGHPLGFTTHFDATTRTLELLLPDGDHPLYIRSANQQKTNAQTVYESRLDVHVAGQPLALHASLVPQATLPVAVFVEHHSTKPTPPIEFFLESTPAGGWNYESTMALLTQSSDGKTHSTDRLDAGRHWLSGAPVDLNPGPGLDFLTRTGPARSEPPHRQPHRHCVDTAHCAASGGGNGFGVLTNRQRYGQVPAL